MRTKAETKTSQPKRRAARQAVGVKSEDHLYLQVARALKKDILDGVYPVGAQLPTEDELCERFDVSRYTVREALRRLREDNLVSSRQGAGTIVVPRHAPSAYAQEVMSINDLVSWAVGKQFIIKSIEMIEVDATLAARTGLPVGEQWLLAYGWGHMEGVACPDCFAEYYIHRDFAAVGRLLPRHTGPIFPLIEDLFGLSIVEVHQEIGAVLLPAELAPELQVEPGSAALEVCRTYTTSEGQVAQVTVSTHPASRFRHSMTMRRVRS
jgi:GntR family transcriptional regulator